MMVDSIARMPLVVWGLNASTFVDEVLKVGRLVPNQEIAGSTPVIRSTRNTRDV